MQDVLQRLLDEAERDISDDDLDQSSVAFKAGKAMGEHLFGGSSDDSQSRRDFVEGMAVSDEAVPKDLSAELSQSCTFLGRSQEPTCVTSARTTKKGKVSNQTSIVKVRSTPQGPLQRQKMKQYHDVAGNERLVIEESDAMSPDLDTVAAVKKDAVTGKVTMGARVGDALGLAEVGLQTPDILMEKKVVEEYSPHVTEEDLIHELYGAHQNWLTMKLGTDRKVEGLLNFNLAVDIKKFIDWLASEGYPVDSTLGQDVKFKSAVNQLRASGTPINRETVPEIAAHLSREMQVDRQSAEALAAEAARNSHAWKPHMSTEDYHKFILSIPVFILKQHSEEVGLRGQHADKPIKQVLKMSDLVSGKGAFPHPGKPMMRSILSMSNMVPMTPQDFKAGSSNISLVRDI